MSKPINDIEERLPDLVDGLELIMMNPANSVDLRTYMRLYTSIHDYCTKIDPGDRRDTEYTGRRNDKNLHREKLYWWLDGFLKRQLQSVRTKITAQSSDMLIAFYVEEWKRYNAAATYNKHIFRFLDRHWVAREGVYDIYSLHLLRWKEDLLEDGQNTIMSSLRQQINSKKDGGDVESLNVHDVLESFDSVGVHDMGGIST